MINGYGSAVNKRGWNLLIKWIRVLMNFLSFFNSDINLEVEEAINGVDTLLKMWILGTYYNKRMSREAK